MSNLNFFPIFYSFGDRSEKKPIFFKGGSVFLPNMRLGTYKKKRFFILIWRTTLKAHQRMGPHRRETVPNVFLLVKALNFNQFKSIQKNKSVKLVCHVKVRDRGNRLTIH